MSRLKTTQIGEERRALQEQVAGLVESGAKPIAIKKVRDELAQLSVDQTTPVSLTELERQPPIPRPLAAGAVVAETDGRLWVPESTRSRVLLASLLGLLVGIVLALLLERFDTRIRSTERAEEAFGMPVLAEVPTIPVGRREGVVTATHPYSRAANAFRLVQTGTARWTAAEPGARTILVTSAEARDGKTTVAANLAAAYAQAGNRVLVISCDLRRPAIHEMFGVAEEPGLTDALGSMDHDGESLKASPNLRPCSILRVAVLPSGRTTDRPGELLGSAAMQRLGERLRKITDVVILDCAPLVVAGDVMPLLPLADGVVVVARAGKTRQGVAARTATLLERQGLVEAGVVMNDAREFSIPLAKRRMYRPTRKTRKARKAAEKQPPGVQGWIATPEVEPQIVEEPSMDAVPSKIIDEPRVASEPDEIVRIPDLGERSSEPVEEGSSRTRGSASDGLKALRDELAALREELVAVQTDPDQPAEESKHSLPIGFRPGPDHSGSADDGRCVGRVFKLRQVDQAFG